MDVRLTTSEWPYQAEKNLQQRWLLQVVKMPKDLGHWHGSVSLGLFGLFHFDFDLLV